MKTIIAFFISIFKPKSHTSYADLMHITVKALKEELILNAKIRLHTEDAYKALSNAKSLKEIMKYLTSNFTFVCSNRILTVNIIERYAPLFYEANIKANSYTMDGFLLVDYKHSAMCDGNTEAVCLGDSTARGFGHSQITAFGNSEITLHDHCVGASFDESIMNLQNNSTGNSYNWSKANLWDKAHVIRHNNSEVTLIGGGTYEIACD
jgi:hypothetical protein